MCTQQSTTYLFLFGKSPSLSLSVPLVFLSLSTLIFCFLGQGLTINKHLHVMMPLLANKSPPANPGDQEAAAAADGLIPDVLGTV